MLHASGYLMGQLLESNLASMVWATEWCRRLQVGQSVEHLVTPLYPYYSLIFCIYSIDSRLHGSISCRAAVRNRSLIGSPWAVDYGPFRGQVMHHDLGQLNTPPLSASYVLRVVNPCINLYLSFLTTGRLCSVLAVVFDHCARAS